MHIWIDFVKLGAEAIEITKKKHYGFIGINSKYSSKYVYGNTYWSTTITLLPSGSLYGGGSNRKNASSSGAS